MTPACLFLVNRYSATELFSLRLRQLFVVRLFRATSQPFSEIDQLVLQYQLASDGP